MKLATILNKFSKLRGAVQALGKLARKFGDTARSMGQLAGRHGSALRQVDGTVGGWNEAITGSLPSGLRGLADNVDDAMAKRLRDGFADTMSPENLARVGLYEGAKEHANADENYDDAVKKQNEQ
ncbi:hypothetical protein ACFSVJ_05615 [Prauserella oleivorans]